METIRERIIQEWIARAEVIRSTGSPQEYATDIGVHVLRARPTYSPTDPPCIIIFPMPEEAEDVYGQTQHRMTMRVEAADYFGSTEPSVISERMLGDIIKCFATPHWDPLPPLAESIQYVAGGIETYPDDGTLVVGAKVDFIVTYYTQVGDPYEQ